MIILIIIIVIYWANNKLKQPNSINSHYNKNGLLCLATACILAAIMYFLTVIGYLKKKSNTYSGKSNFLQEHVLTLITVMCHLFIL